MSQYTIIDDRDPSVKYTGTWTVGGTTNEYDGTVSSTLTAGDSFTVPFTGSGIAVYGTYDASSGGVETRYTLDSDAPVNVQSIASSGADDYRQLFWQSDPFSYGTHTLQVTMVNLNIPNSFGPGEGTIWFDFFNVTTATTSSSAASSASDTTTSSSPTTSSASSPGTSSSSPISTSSGGSTSSAVQSSSSGGSTTVLTTKKSSHGGLIGGIVAAVVVFVAVVAIFFILRRRRKQQERDEYLPQSTGYPVTPRPPSMSRAAGGQPASFDPHSTFAAPTAPQAFVQPHGAAQAEYNPYAAPQPAFATGVAYTSSASGSSQPSSSGANSRRGSTPLRAVGSEASGGSVAGLKRQQQQLIDSYEAGLGGRAEPIRHVDSGLRGSSVAQPQSELPPMYTPD